MAAQMRGMGGEFWRFLVVAVLALSWRSKLTMRGVEAQLDNQYYASTCPNVENIARTAFLNRVGFFNIASLPANILRLIFHDCQVNGCDASVLLNSNADGSITDEKLSPANLGIGNIPVIEYIKQQMDAQCSDANGNPVVSCADVLALAGREAYNFAKGIAGLGNTVIGIGLGRKDGLGAQTTDANAQLLPADSSVDDVLANFARMNLNVQESVALLGSHTIGVAHCASIANRIFPQPDATLSSPFNPLLPKLRANCPPNYSQNTVINNDQTNTFFDNQYFLNVIVGQGLLTVDDNLRKDSRTAGYVNDFARNQQSFFDIFAEAYVKLTSFNVLTGNQGEVRKNCLQVN